MGPITKAVNEAYEHWKLRQIDVGKDPSNENWLKHVNGLEHGELLGMLIGAEGRIETADVGLTIVADAFRWVSSFEAGRFAIDERALEQTIKSMEWGSLRMDGPVRRIVQTYLDEVARGRKG